ncbi:HK97 family phage prohead protease [Mesorhizobium sp. CAU 1732]|uniref:HK97 family phage prohead protease n=1 Tax=Mesorhizobium sp. CAU 1732 TaxID=3140358 RepID=UPI00326054A3
MSDKTNQTPKTSGGPADLPVVTREAAITTINVETRTIDVTWTTGAAGERFDWFSGVRYIEELAVDDKSVRLDRLNAGAPVLDSHNRYGGLSSMIAVVERAWIEKGEGRATVRFPKAVDDPDADRVFRKVQDGIIRSLSVGYRRLKIEVDKKKDPQVWRVIDWEPFEISFVAVPFDLGAQVRDGDSPKHPCQFVSVDGDENAARRARMRMRQRAA